MQPKEQAKEGSEISTIINPKGVICHTFSPDLTKIAISIKGDSTVEIYELTDINNPVSWKLMQTLKEHTQTVSVIDWSIKNEILTASYDRNVLVWSQNNDAKAWKFKFVVMRGNKRGIIDGSWTLDGRKFGVCSGQHKIFVNQWEEKLNWWGTQKISGFKSSVLCIAFHPSGRVVSAGSADQSFKIISCQVDKQDSLEYTGPFAEVKTFGDVLQQVNSCGGWVESTLWSPSGNQFAAAVHNSTVWIGSFTKDENWKAKEKTEKKEEEVDEGEDTPYKFSAEESIKWDSLPFRALCFKNENTLICGGYDYIPISFTKSGGNWKFEKKYTVSELGKQQMTKTESKVYELIKKAESVPISKLKEKETEETKDIVNVSIHSTPILGMKPIKRNTISNNVEKIMTNDVHGKLLVWSLD